MDAIYGRKQHRQGEGNLSGKKKSSTTDACILSGLNTLCFFPVALAKKKKNKRRRRLSWHIHTPINLLRISDNHLKTQLQVKLSMNSTLTRHPESLEEKTSIPLFISSIYIW
jgi:hypothetical protein